MKKQKILILGAGALMSMGILAGCSTPPVSTGYTYNTYLSTSPKTWNTHNWETSDESYVSGFCEIGLYDYILTGYIAAEMMQSCHFKFVTGKYIDFIAMILVQGKGSLQSDSR